MDGIVIRHQAPKVFATGNGNIRATHRYPPETASLDNAIYRGPCVHIHGDVLRAARLPASHFHK